MNKIREIRERVGISRTELSKRSGVPLRTIENWELEQRRPTDARQLQKIAKELGVIIEDLIDYE